MSDKLRWGFIGAGYIATIALYPALLKSQKGEIYAIGCKDKDRGLLLSPNGLVYTDYEELIADPKVEAVYISLPNSLHIEWSIKAMKAGKHVLCEKPLGMNAQEVRSAISAAKETGTLFMEASWNRWHPRTIRMKEIIDSGEIGKVRTIRSAFTYDGLDSSNIRAIPELGGGGVYDLGPYSIAAPLWIMDFAPVSDVSTDVKWHPQGSDETVTSYFTVGTAKAEALTSMNTPSTLYLEVIGEKGSVELLGNDAFNSHNKESSLKVSVDGLERVENFEACDPYMLMADAFADRVKGRDGWLLPHEQSVAFAELFDRIFESMGRP